MRKDPGLEFPEGFTPGGLDLPGRHFDAGVSQSGRERNHYFRAEGGGRFDDLSGLSGADDPADGRAFALLDYDRDGFQDLAVVNANAPLFQLFRNEQGGAAGSGGALALRLVGANRSASADSGRSNRDGIGARVEVRVGEATLVRELRAGEGFAAQNSATLLVGIGDRAGADAVTVTWPSGAVTRVRDVPVERVTTVYEDAAMSPSGDAATRAVYAPANPRSAVASADDTRLMSRLSDGAPLRVLLTIATWCEACRDDLPQVANLRSTFGADELALYGAPVDEGDTPGMLAEWVANHRPAWRLIADATPEESAEIARFVRDTLGRDAVPASIVTDGGGRVLATSWGVPTISDLRRIAAGADGR